MYIQCKHGFVEADRWDGSVIPIRGHMHEIHSLGALTERSRTRVIVLRSRFEDTVFGMLDHIERFPEVWFTPDWDYQFRAYVTLQEFKVILAGIANDLTYRNFKHWAQDNSPEQYRLAHDVWRVAHDDKARDYERLTR